MRNERSKFKECQVCKRSFLIIKQAARGRCYCCYVYFNKYKVDKTTLPKEYEFKPLKPVLDLRELSDFIDSINLKVITPLDGLRICHNYLNYTDENLHKLDFYPQEYQIWYMFRWLKDFLKENLVD